MPDVETPAARTLTEALKGVGRHGLVDLLTLRPDLSYPPPQDLAELASRAGTSTSVARAVEQLNAWLRLVAEALAALPDPSSSAEAAQLAQFDPERVREAVAELRRRALLWGADDALHLVRGVREYFEPYPGGLAPPSLRPLSQAQITAALADCGDSVQPVLERLLWSPTGAVRNAERVVAVGEARSPVEQLLAHQLLRPLDGDTVVLPREVALQLRSGRFSREPVSPDPPALAGVTRDAALVDQAAAGAAYGMLHDLELAVYALESSPHRLLRTGGLATRDITLLARSLGTDVRHAGFVMECASAAGLVAPGSNLCLLPTTEFDRWADRPGAERWRAVVSAWAGLPRHPSRSVEAGAHVLGPEAHAPGAPTLRRVLLQLVVDAGVGRVIALPDLTAAVGWHLPRAAQASPGLARLVELTWQEAGWLGLTSLGAASSYASTMLAPEAEMPARLVDLFPTPVERVIVQADLTAIAPGPLTHQMATELRLLADQESRGGGGVYRFSPTSLRRAFDAGWSSGQLHSWLQQHSTTGVPQPLAYLVDDVARQYGGVRVGSALSYVRVEDTSQAAALLGHPDAEVLGLRQLAPGVLLSSADPSELVSFLRGVGAAPAVEDSDGRTVSPPPPLRAPTPQRDLAPRPPTAADAASVMLAAERRRGRVPRGGPDARPPAQTEETLQALQWATRDAHLVRVVYVSADGERTERELSPFDVAAGMMRAVDRASAQVLNIPLARISSVSRVDSGTSTPVSGRK